MQKRKRVEIICRCNNISRSEIEDAIKNGACDTLNKIFDATTAGVGPCGGSCRRKLKPLLDHYLQTGTFPEKIIEDLTGKLPPKKGNNTESDA
ncbi:MAG: (2Fe-2S)-binding protein [Pseudobdellovibrionaceae bacterium]